MVEAEALGHRARELLLADGAVGDEQPLGERAALLGASDRLVDGRLVDEAEVGDDVRQHAARATAP